jgi:hypothetical protein
LALIYIDRLIQRNNFLLTELNVHRVVISAILLAAKFFDDAYYNNAYYAKIGGVLVAEMNGLEVDFLFRINFSLHVTPELFQKYRAELVSHAVGAGVTMPMMTIPHTTRPTAHTVDVAMAPTHHQEQIAVHHQPGLYAACDPGKEPSYVTPSPPGKPVFYASASTSDESEASQVMMHQAASMPATAHSGLAEAMLAAGNVHSYPLPQRCSPRFNGASTMPVVGTMGSMDGGGEQYVVIDNVAYLVQGGMIHVNHGETTAGKGHPHHTGDGYHSKSEQATAVTVTPHFVG